MEVKNMQERCDMKEIQKMLGKDNRDIQDK